MKTKIRLTESLKSYHEHAGMFLRRIARVVLTLALCSVCASSLWAGEPRTNPSVFHPVGNAWADPTSSYLLAGTTEANTFYLPILTAESAAPDLLEQRITSRYQNSDNLRFVQSLSADTGIALYLETAQLIDRRHIQPTAYPVRIRQALKNLMQAVDTTAFLQANRVSPTRTSVDQFKGTLTRLIQGDYVRSSNDALNLMRWTVDLASKQLRLSPGAVISEFIYGATESLDRYSRFVPPARMGGPRVDLGDHVVGIGVSIEPHDRGAQIVKVLSGGPAADARLRNGDVITHVDGLELAGRSIDQIVDRIVGPTGSAVKIGVRREESSFTSTLMRRYIPIKSVTDVSMLDASSKTGYFKLEKFVESSSEEMDQALWSLHRQGMKSLIIDLRGNPGGLLTSAIDLSNKFVPCGSIVSTRGRTSADNTREAASYSQTWKVPLVVIIDGNSASASEIFAAAIQENQRGMIVGERSYGKGTVQTQFPLQTLEGGLRLTTARFYSPKGRVMAGAGVEPDVVVDLAQTPTPLADPAITKALTVANGQRVVDLAIAKSGCGRPRGELYLIPS